MRVRKRKMSKKAHFFVKIKKRKSILKIDLRKKILLFDFDGTISDSFDYVADFLVSEANLPPFSGEQKQNLRGMSMVGAKFASQLSRS